MTAYASDEVELGGGSRDTRESLDFPTRPNCDSRGNSLNMEDDTGMLTEMHVDRYDVLKRLAIQIKSSVSFLVLYIVLILANLFVLIWEFAGKSSHIAVVLVEALINFMFLAEIVVEMLIQGLTRYFDDNWNRVDFLVCVFCLLFFIVFCFENTPDNHTDISNYLDGILIGLRYSIQLIRFCRFAKNARRAHHIKRSQIDTIVFDNHSLGQT